MNYNTLPHTNASATPAPEGLTYTIAGKDVPVIELISGTDYTVSLIDIPLMSDYKWKLNCLKDRLKHPEIYRDALGEDVEATIKRIKIWLTEHADEYTKTLLKGA